MAPPLSEDERMLSPGRILGTGAPAQRSSTERSSQPAGSAASSAREPGAPRRDVGEELRLLQQEELELQLQLDLQERRNRVALLKERLSCAELPLPERISLERGLEQEDHSQGDPSIPSSPPASNEGSFTPASSFTSFVPPSTSRTRVKAPADYYGKNLKEHSNFMWQCEIAFRQDASYFTADATKVLHAMQALRGEPRDRWKAFEDEYGKDRHTFNFFSEFLLNLIQDPVNRQLAAAEKYHAAEQRQGQSVHSFATYIEDLEADLETYTDEQRRLHLLARLRPDLKAALRSMQILPARRTELVSLAARIEDNLRQTPAGRASTRRPSPAAQGGYQPSQQNPNSIPVGTGASASRPTRGVGPSYRRGGGRGRGGAAAPTDRTGTTDLSNIECYNCHRMGHYANACPERPSGVGADNRPKNGRP